MSVLGIFPGVNRKSIADAHGLGKRIAKIQKLRDMSVMIVLAFGIKNYGFFLTLVYSFMMNEYPNSMPQNSPL